MKAFKRSIALGLILILSLTLLVACGKKDEENKDDTGSDNIEDNSGDVLKGTWEGKDSNTSDCKFVFDGKGGLTYSDNDPGTYTITGDQVEINVEFWSDARTYTFVIDDGKLTLTPPEDKYYVGFDLEKK